MLKKLNAAIFATSLFCWCAIGPVKSVASEDLALRDKIYIASKTYSLVTTYFAHWQGAPNLDIDTAYKEYLDEVLKSQGRYEFDLATLEFVARLRNGHSGFSDNWLVRNFGQELGFAASVIQEEWVITRSRVEGLEPGDVIVTIEGQPMDGFFREKEKYIPASNQRAAKIALFSMAFLFPERFTLMLKEGRNVIVDRKNQKLSAEPALETQGRWIAPDKIAYVRIPSFDDPKFQAGALDYVNRFAKAENLILDVRGNHGGTTPEQLIDALMDRPYRSYLEVTTDHIGYFEASAPSLQINLSWVNKPTKPKNTLFKGRLLILADGGCFSACEDFVVPFKDNHRAVIVGDTTAGSSGQPYGYWFDNDMAVGIGAKREFFPDGSPFEGVGVAPEIEVHPTIQDLKNGNDPVLNKAIELAHQS